MNINNRYRVLTQDLNRLTERIDERIESETNNSIETYRKFMEGLRVKLTRIRDDYRLTIDMKQRLINVNSLFFVCFDEILFFSLFLQEISHSLIHDRVYVYRAIEHIKLTRSLFNNEYNINEIDDECQVIDDEWVEFSSDFDDQKQGINQIESDMKKIDSKINETYQWLREQENSFQLMIANQPTLELKLEKLEQIKVKIFFHRFFFFF
jgi:archaellum component FlaC